MIKENKKRIQHEERGLVLETEDLREEYIRKLGELFHHKSAVDLARLFFNGQNSNLVNDYVSIVCLDEFKQKYQEEASKLEKEAQILLKSEKTYPVFESQGDYGPFGLHPNRSSPERPPLI